MSPFGLLPLQLHHKLTQVHGNLIFLPNAPTKTKPLRSCRKNRRQFVDQVASLTGINVDQVALNKVIQLFPERAFKFSLYPTPAFCPVLCLLFLSVQF
jgi:hypothetical protein